MVACSIDECEKPSRKRGWCEMHYSRYKVHGDPLTTLRRSWQSAVCNVEGCDRIPLAKDKCRAHYYRDYWIDRGETSWQASVRLHPELRPGPAIRKPSEPTLCSIEDCSNTARGRGWCGKHYQRWRRFGDPTFQPPDIDRHCTVDGCDGIVNGRGLCGKHYRRWQLYGDPSVTAWTDQTASDHDHPCAVPNCPRKLKAAGYCTTHYTRLRRHGDPLIRGKAETLRECATCGADFDPGTGRARKYCGKRCKPSGRISGSVNKRSWVEKLGNEDGWHCHLCDSPVDAALYWPNPRAGSVDHVLPVSYGGTDERTNLRLAHVGCNSARKNRLLTE